MILCLDIGNTQIYGGVFSERNLILRFRHDSRTSFSSDQFGIFLRTVLRENDIDPKQIEQIALCSVVPSLDYTLTAACQKYFDLVPFRLQAGVKTGLKIKYRNPVEVGADRIANAVAASQFFPNTNCIIIDFGTATTLCVLTQDREYLGGAIMPGMRLSMDALQHGTAKLSSVNIIEPQDVIGRSTIERIQSGLFYAQLGALERIIAEVKQQHFEKQSMTVIGTGGFAHLFQHKQLFEHYHPELVLHGLLHLIELNQTQIA